MRMKNNSINMIYLFIIFGLVGNRYPVNAQLYNIDTLREFAASSYDIIKSINDENFESSTPSTSEILNGMQDVIAMIGKWDPKFKERVEAINKFILGLPSAEEMELDVYNSTFADIGWIDDLYEEFRDYVETPDSLGQDDAEELSELYTCQGSGNLMSAIHDIFSTISPEKWGNYKSSLFFRISRKAQKDYIKLCGVNVPLLLLDFCSVIIITEMRAVAMIDFGYLMKGLKGNVSYTDDIKRTEEGFMQRVEIYLIIIERAVKFLPTQFRTCDPPEGYIRGESFYEFEKFLTTVIVNEGTITGTLDCSDSCRRWNPTRFYRCDGIGCDNGEYICQGALKDCVEMHWADFCQVKGDGRRYKWIRDNAEIAKGFHPPSDGHCEGKFQWPRPFSSWIGFRCDICRCLCIDDVVSSRSKHFISLREQLSDVADNMVIVGVKFREVDKILHIEIRQGVLGSNATIVENTLRWKALEDIQYDRDGSIRSGAFKFYKDNDDGDREELITDKDVAAFNYYERRFHLDKLSAPPEHFITGIRFARAVNEWAKPIHLEIQATPFEFESGDLDSKKSIWIGPKSTPYGLRSEKRIKYKDTGRDNPATSTNTVIRSDPNGYMDVDWTNWMEDAGQTVVPLFDGRTSSFDPPVGLTSIGLYAKGQEGYGSILTFVLESIDMTPFINHHRPGRYVKEGKN